jgi:hypothetical protein
MNELNKSVNWLARSINELKILTLYKEAKDRFCPCFYETLKKIKIIDKNLISAEKYSIFQIKATKSRKRYFL